MDFSYTAIDSDGRTRQGQLSAPDAASAVQALQTQGLTPLEVQESVAAPARRRRREGSARTALVLMVRELASLLLAGVTLEESLRTLLEGRHDSHQQPALQAVLGAVLAGESFSSALQLQAEQKTLNLPSYVLALVAAGETTGDLAGALSRAADQLEFDERIRAETSEALVYPSILITAGIGAVVFVFSFVVPRFSSLLQGRKADLPWLSTAVLSTGQFFNQHGGLLMLGLGAAALLIWIALRSVGTQRIRGFVAQLPVVGRWMQQQELSRWTGMLALMLQSRVPILQALDLTANAVGLPEQAQALRGVMLDVGRGQALSQAISSRELLPATALSMVKVGERTGQVGAMMAHVAAYTLEENRRLRRRLVALIEPAAILILGGMVAVIVVGVVLALTSLSAVEM